MRNLLLRETAPLTERWLTCALLRHRSKIFLIAHLKSLMGGIFGASRDVVSDVQILPTPVTSWLPDRTKTL